MNRELMHLFTNAAAQTSILLVISLKFKMTNRMLKKNASHRASTSDSSQNGSLDRPLSLSDIHLDIFN
jgi:hypothetical protein